jgi:hypothetical protein
VKGNEINRKKKKTKKNEPKKKKTGIHQQATNVDIQKSKKKFYRGIVC